MWIDRLARTRACPQRQQNFENTVSTECCCCCCCCYVCSSEIQPPPHLSQRSLVLLLAVLLPWPFLVRTGRFRFPFPFVVQDQREKRTSDRSAKKKKKITCVLQSAERAGREGMGHASQTAKESNAKKARKYRQATEYFRRKNKEPFRGGSSKQTSASAEDRGHQALARSKPLPTDAGQLPCENPGKPILVFFCSPSPSRAFVLRAVFQPPSFTETKCFGQGFPPSDTKTFGIDSATASYFFSSRLPLVPHARKPAGDPTLTAARTAESLMEQDGSHVSIGNRGIDE